MSDVGYRDSFRKLGYELGSVRQHWSAKNEDGVCLSLWSKEMRPGGGLLEMDSNTDCGPIETWASAGRNKRHEHLCFAWDECDRWIDVVIRQGHSWENGVPSEPWLVTKKKHKFRLQEFDRESGHFSVKLEPFDAEI